MTYEKDPIQFEEIPDYALQPAKEADEYNFHYVPRGATSRFDPAAYEKVLHDSVRQAAEGKTRNAGAGEKMPESSEHRKRIFPRPLRKPPEAYADAEEVSAGGGTMEAAESSGMLRSQLP
jgi:hypothetical protein